MTRSYVMESEEEALRLDLKTDPEEIRRQAGWAGLEPGMRVADFGCGSGKATAVLAELVGSGGEAVGVDISPQRLDYARTNYPGAGVTYEESDIRQPLDHLGLFDFVWVRFVLEHYRRESFDIVKNITRSLRPGGTLCLVDLDYNCLTHYGLSPKLEGALQGVMRHLEEGANFDPYVGRKLYSFLYDLACTDLDVRMEPYHLFFGNLSGTARFNWRKKLEVAARNSGYPFAEFRGGFEGFREEFNSFFDDPRRFTYTPIILARGRKV